MEEAPLVDSEAGSREQISATEEEVPARATKTRARPADVLAQTKASRGIELRHALIVLALLIFVIAAFYAGRRFDYLKYNIMTRLNAKQLEGGPDKFPNLSAAELIETGLAAEKRGDWQDASERFIAAKHKDLTLPGLLYRVGKGSYDRGDLPSADLALSHAIRFGENVPSANFYRGMIAVRRHDLPAAIRFFETAASAEPFNADLYYFWGEALRLDFKPRDAIKRYEQALMRTPSTTEMTLCSFKIRLALIEAAEASKVAAELEKVREAGPLPVDWLMTDAALQIQAGKYAEAAQLISQARNSGVTGLFLTCAGDTMFVRSGEAHPEIAAAIGSGN